MNRRSRRAPRGVRIAVAVFALIAAVLAVILAAQLLSGALKLVRTDGGATEPDPQFAEPAETVTRPPELMGEGEGGAPDDDPSAHWNLGEQTPVDKTAEELSREEMGE